MSAEDHRSEPSPGVTVDPQPSSGVTADAAPSAGATADADSLSGGGSTASSPSLAFLRQIARVPEVVPAAPIDADESGAFLAAGEDPPRFALRRRLGSGGFGTVYEAFDRKRGALVALKVLRRPDGRAISLFKQEFRALAGIVHPRLVRLYELHRDDARWFFTLELVPGTDVLTHVRGEGGPDEARLRAAFREIAEGLAFLHDAGKLHRDIKPSNVMVDAAGAVKVLDFGLVADLNAATAPVRAGTPRYMAPEQAAGLAVGPAADMYAVGVMLHQALTGRLPAQSGAAPAPGPLPAQGGAAPAPGPAATAAPEDLDRLCRELLAHDPAARPTAREVAARLLGQAAGAPIARRPAPAAPFVGRAAELGRLHAALDEARAGRTAVALLRGSSGIGKSALLQRFLESAGGEPGAVPLAGRCFQQESVPYKALDGVVDELGRLLARAAPEDLAAWLPDDVVELGRAFPVLREVPAIAAAAPREGAAPDDAERRRRAFAALRELCARLGRARALVLAVDDLQWGDLDSVALLAELMRPPAAPPLLFVASYRAEEAETSPVLRALLAALREGLAADVRVHEIDVGELPPADAAALAGALLAGAGASGGAAARIAAEAHHSPLFITELSRLAVERGDLGGAAPDLSALLAGRIERLPAPARRLLEVVAVAGQPIARRTAARAAQAEGEALDEPEALSRLVAAQVVRVREAHEREELLPYHDRVGEAVLAALPRARRREHHLRLARALEGQGGAEPSLLVHHLRGAGLDAEAAARAVEAAAQAQAALAFDRAARFAREALELGEPFAAVARGARLALAAALASGGRSREAAEAYLDLASREPPREALAHRLRAMQLLLAGGYVDEGLSVLDGVLAELGLSRPASTLEALAQAAALRARLWARGLAFRERAEREIPARDLLAMDACHAAASLAVTAPVQSAPFAARHLLLALDAGEPHRLARALTLETIHAALRGQRDGGRRAAALLALLERVAARSPRPEARNFHLLAEGVAAFARGELERAEVLLGRSSAALGAHGGESGSGGSFAHALLATVLWLQGKIPGLAATTADLLAEARERGDRYRETMIRLNGAYLLDLAADRPASARATVDAAMERWSRAGYHVQHFREALARGRIALYEGDAAAALRFVLAATPPLLGSGMVAIPLVRGELHYLRALASLAVAARGSARAIALRALALADARALDRRDVFWGPSVAAMIRASVAAQRGRAAEAAERMRGAEAALGRLGAALLAAAARRARGIWLGGDEGRALVAAADAWMEARGVRRPARFAATLAG
ncbi:protein kinase domain-containing protein [Sorangium sp. So ce341]|uniref:protein kinase domain-containing protein n=1 Tax=Sorangium sp. So ce341 TaxID=3133302 RepID=UPI003F5EFF3C